MTPLDLAMKAGRELDALVAEKVMGWVWAHSPQADEAILISPEAVAASWQKLDGTEPRYTTYHNVRHYSTDIAAAWEVVGKMHADSFDASLDDSFGEWTVSFRRYFVYENGLRYYKTRLPLAFGESDTAPLAICLAALKAVEAP